MKFNVNLFIASSREDIEKIIIAHVPRRTFSLASTPKKRILDTVLVVADYTDEEIKEFTSRIREALSEKYEELRIDRYENQSFGDGIFIMKPQERIPTEGFDTIIIRG